MFIRSLGSCNVGWGAKRLMTVKRASGAKVVAPPVHRTMNKLNIILAFLVYKPRFFQH